MKTDYLMPKIKKNLHCPVQIGHHKIFFEIIVLDWQQ